MKNTFGNAISLTIFGESHGPAVGAVLDGLAAGLPVDVAAIAAAMDRRVPAATDFPPPAPRPTPWNFCPAFMKVIPPAPPSR